MLYNFVFVAIGFVFLGLSLIGIIIPILPTTPFLILASICFVKGSSKFDRWFRKTKIYKNYAEDFVNNRSMTLKRKFRIMALSDFMLLIPFIRVDNIYIRIFIVALVLIKDWYFIFRIKTINE